MRSKTVLYSVLLHVAVFGAALQVSVSRAKRRATAVAVIGAEKKKAAPKKPVAPPPPRRKPVMVASARPVLHEAPRAVAPEPAPAAHEAPVDTGLTLGNADGPGIDVGTPAPSAPKPAPKTAEKAPRPKKVASKVLAPAARTEEDNCTEAPSKPAPVQRPNEIEYTQEARANGIEGRLILRITVAADGSVARVEVLSPVDPALDAAAIAAVKTWVFKPSMRCGKAMAGGTYTLARRFELGD